MARQETIILIDDLDGGNADGTYKFGLDGQDYEIDLSPINSAALRDAVQPFVEAARRVPKSRLTRGSKPGGYTNGRAASTMHSARSTPAPAAAFTDVTLPDSPPVPQSPPAPAEPGIPAQGIIARVLGQGPKRRRLTTEDLDPPTKTAVRAWNNHKFEQTKDPKYKVAERGRLPQTAIDLWADNLYAKREAAAAAKAGAST